MSMSISERVEFEAMKRRIANLEARVSADAARSPDGLRRRNESRQADVHRLDKAISAILASHPNASALTAKELGKALERSGFDRVVPERTLRRHLTAIRGHGHT